MFLPLAMTRQDEHVTPVQDSEFGASPVSCVEPSGVDASVTLHPSLCFTHQDVHHWITSRTRGDNFRCCVDHDNLWCWTRMWFVFCVCLLFWMIQSHFNVWVICVYIRDVKQLCTNMIRLGRTWVVVLSHSRGIIPTLYHVYCEVFRSTVVEDVRWFVLNVQCMKLPHGKRSFQQQEYCSMQLKPTFSVDFVSD